MARTNAKGEKARASFCRSSRESMQEIDRTQQIGKTGVVFEGLFGLH